MFSNAVHKIHVMYITCFITMLTFDDCTTYVPSIDNYIKIYNCIKCLHTFNSKLVNHTMSGM